MSLGGLKMFDEKNLGKCTLYIGIEVIPGLRCPDFQFHQFQYNVTNTFGKNYPNAKLQVS